MFKEYIGIVECEITIKLDNKKEIILNLEDETTDSDNYVTDIEINESAASNGGKNPVGTVSASNIVLRLNSIDKMLMPENTKSSYYGYMNNTATISVVLKYVEEDTETYREVTFNKFYVNNWESNISSSSPYDVVIEASDIMSTVGKSDAFDIYNGYVDANTLLEDTLTEYNDSVLDKYRVYRNDTTFNETFGTVNAINFDCENMSDWLNTLAQSTLHNMYLDRGTNEITIDYCLDDTVRECVCELHENESIMSASINNELVNYTGVKVNYVNNSMNSTYNISSIKDQKLVAGENIIDGIKVAGVYKINYVRLNTGDTSSVELTGMQYKRNEITLVIKNNTSNSLKCDIDIFGQTIKQNNKSVTKLVSDDSRELLEVTNKLLSEDKALEFADELLRLIKYKNSSLSLSGNFNPAIKLGDTVYIDCTNSIGVVGYYKVVELNWKMNSKLLDCDMKVIKTIASSGDGDTNG